MAHEESGATSAAGRGWCRLDRALGGLSALCWAILLLLVAGGVALATINLVVVGLGERPYVVVSGSMAPAIPVGSIAVVDPRVPPAALAVGDVITFVAPGNVTVTHRIVRVVTDARGLGLETKGDANRVADATPVRPENLRGRVVFVIPLGGYAVVYGRPQTIGPVIIACVVGLLGLRGLRRLVAERAGRASPPAA